LNRGFLCPSRSRTSASPFYGLARLATLNGTALLNGSTKTTYYTYDPYDRLTGACSLQNCTGSGLSGLSYTYDPVGNRLTQVKYGTFNVTTTYAYNPDDQLCWSYVGTSSNPCSSPPSGATIYTFEANGNETGAGSTAYTYDLENRMTSATVSGTATTYTYDGHGNRLSATTGGSTTSYLWDVNRAMALLALERNGGSTLRDYSYGVGLNSMNSGGVNYFYLTDAYSNVANVTSAVGSAEWTYANDPFGTSTATKNDPNAPANVMRFNSQFFDTATNLYDLRARTYDPALGRLQQIDPLQPALYAPAFGRYGYARDDPTRLADPTGLNDCGIFSFVCDVGHVVAGTASWVGNHPAEAAGIALGAISLATGVGEVAGATFVIGDLTLSSSALGGISVLTGLTGTGLDAKDCFGGRCCGMRGIRLGRSGCHTRPGWPSARGDIVRERFDRSRVRWSWDGGNWIRMGFRAHFLSRMSVNAN
jgi:RHS repeat-associated protein